MSAREPATPGEAIQPAARPQPGPVKVGDRFGEWTVIETGLRNKHGQSIALCRCGSCGREHLVLLSSLRSGKSRGCQACALNARTTLKAPRKGRKFGRLTVLSARIVRVGPRGERAVLCRCSCGTVTAVRIKLLACGDTRSCGCFQREELGERTTRMARLRPTAGQRFGRLVVLTGEIARLHGRRAVLCRCDCGAQKLVLVDMLFGGKTRSCGCLRREVARETARTSPARLASLRTESYRAMVSERSTIHGLSGHPLYRVWTSMMGRCYKPGTNGYRNYGGRAVGAPIKVCKPWHDVRVFVADIEREIGPRPEGRTPGGMPLWTIDRIDVNGNYEPGNVQWADWETQRGNRRPMIGNELVDAPEPEMWCGKCGETMTSLSAFDKHLRQAHPRAKAS